LFLKKNRYNNPPCTYITPDTNSLDGAGLHGLDVDSVNFISDYLRIYVSLQVKPCFIRKECQLQIDLTFGDRL
jgi:hypothetical protein